MVSKPGPDCPFMCSGICPWNRPLSHLQADAKDKAHIRLWDLWPRLPGSAVALLNQPPDGPGPEGQLTAGARAVPWPQSLGTSEASSWSILSPHLSDGDTEAREGGVTQASWAPLKLLSPVAPLPLSTQSSKLSQTLWNCIQICSNTQTWQAQYRAGGYNRVLAVVLQEGLYGGPTWELEGSYEGTKP